MKKSILIAALGLFSLNAMAQDTKPKEGLVFTTVKESPTTPIKSQNRSSTCWSFSALGFPESELLRLGKDEYDLSEMSIVHKMMKDRGTNYARHHGDSSFSPGGSFYDIIYCMKNYGLVLQKVMPGIMYGDTLPVHNRLDAVVGGYTNVIARDKFTKLTPVWKKGLGAIYDIYLGACPENFAYKGKEYTPKTFAESLGPKAEDYVSPTSYTHHPSYSQLAVEIQDDWHNGLSYNLPFGKFMAVMGDAVKQGYTLAWGSGVSKQGFAYDGVVVMPGATEGAELTDSDMTRWTGLTATDKRRELTFKPLPETEITQEVRQTAFDSWEITNDHRMMVYNITKNQNGEEYFMIKNSWGTSGKYKGIRHASKAFVAYKTMSILVYKDVLPKEIVRKLDIR